MLNKYFTLLLSAIALLVSCVGFSTTHKNSLGVDDRVPLKSQEEQKDFSQVESWIRNLRSNDAAEREAAKNEIITFSAKSPEARQYTIKELLPIVKVSEGPTELWKSQPRFFEWKEATDILGTIKATEAIDVLIDCLDCNNGPSDLGPGRYPATLAIIKMGDQAIPKLAFALEEKTLGVRYRAAQALYLIGVDSAKAVLEKAVRNNKNAQTTNVIKAFLRNWNGSRTNKI